MDKHKVGSNEGRGFVLGGPALGALEIIVGRSCRRSQRAHPLGPSPM